MQVDIQELLQCNGRRKSTFASVLLRIIFENREVREYLLSISDLPITIFLLSRKFARSSPTLFTYTLFDRESLPSLRAEFSKESR